MPPQIPKRIFLPVSLSIRCRSGPRNTGKAQRNRHTAAILFQKDPIFRFWGLMRSDCGPSKPWQKPAAKGGRAGFLRRRRALCCKSSPGPDAPALTRYQPPSGPGFRVFHADPSRGGCFCVFLKCSFNIKHLLPHLPVFNTLNKSIRNCLKTW
jgi:hypothetical protein